MSDDIIAAKQSQELLDYLLKRRSVPIKLLCSPGPSKEQIRIILQAASRVPDHGKLFPWYFMVFEGETRKGAGDLIARAWKEQDPEAAPAKMELEKERFTRAPVIIAVISRIRKSKNPVWEQILSAGAVCQNLCLAANALGFGTNWITEWYAYSKTFKAELGIADSDHIAGFIYIGTPSEQPEERDRPDLDQIVTYWEPGKKLNKGTNYGHEGVGWPDHGFDFSDIP